jgi:hypothetical protein
MMNLAGVFSRQAFFEDECLTVLCLLFQNDENFLRKMLGLSSL